MAGTPHRDSEGDLRFADRQVAEAEALCQRQVALIAHLRAHGQDFVDAEELLGQLQDTLALMRRLQQRLADGTRS